MSVGIIKRQYGFVTTTRITAVQCMLYMGGVDIYIYKKCMQSNGRRTKRRVETSERNAPNLTTLVRATEKAEGRTFVSYICIQQDLQQV